MVKLQFNPKTEQVSVTIPRSKAKSLGWLDKLKKGESVEVDPSTLPDRDGISMREV